MLPRRLYELLPALYVIVGLTALAAADDLLGAGSAALLLSAAAVIIKMRRDYRRGLPC